MAKTVTRREFARATAAVGAAAVAVPSTLLGKTAAETTVTTSTSTTAMKGAAAARRRIVVPPGAGYGGEFAGEEYRDSISLAHAPLGAAGQAATPRDAAPVVVRGWRE